MTLVVDSGGLSALARQRARLQELRRRGRWPAQVPTVVLTEALTGDHGRGFQINGCGPRVREVEVPIRLCHRSRTPDHACMTDTISRDALVARLACVQATWRREQRLHVGNVAWSWSGADGTPTPTASWQWGELDLLAFADAWVEGDEAEVDLHVSPRAPRALISQVLRELTVCAPTGSVSILDRERHLIDAVTNLGLQRSSAAPWFVQLWRSLDIQLGGGQVPADYVIRPTRPEERDARVQLHRDCWAPARIKQLLGLPLDGTEPPSSFSAEKYARVMATPLYRRELDLVVEAPDGRLAAFALGWLDEASHSILIEPVGTIPAQAGRGFGRAVCAELLRAGQRHGATQAVVRPRGDAAYPVPRHLYERLGMRAVGREVTYVWGR